MTEQSPRSALPRDAAALERLAAASRLSFAAPSEAHARLVVDDPEGPGIAGAALVVRRDDAIANAEFAGPGEHPCAVLEGLWVAEERRRRGVGRALFEAALAWARAENLRSLCVGVDVEARRGADGALAAWGCKRVTTLVHFVKELKGPAPPAIAVAARARPITEADADDLLRIRAYSDPTTPRVWHLVELRRLLDHLADAPPAAQTRAGFVVEGVGPHAIDGYVEVLQRSAEVAELRFIHGFRPYYGLRARELAVGAALLDACEAWARARGCARLLTADDVGHEHYSKGKKLLTAEHGFARVGYYEHLSIRAAPRPQPPSDPPAVIAAVEAYVDGRAPLSALIAALREPAPPVADLLDRRVRYYALPSTPPPVKPSLLARIKRRLRPPDTSARERAKADYTAAIARFARSAWATRWDPDALFEDDRRSANRRSLVAYRTPTAYVEDRARSCLLLRHTTLSITDSYVDELFQLLLTSPFLWRVRHVRISRGCLSLAALRRVLDPAVLPALTSLDLNGSGGDDWATSSPWESPTFISAMIGHEHLELIASSPHSQRLRYLGVAYNGLPLADAARILDSPHLCGLERLDAVPGNFEAGPGTGGNERAAAVARLARRFGE
ncbi:MAG: GNAT family N-acetyltransferase, partial [Myxococcales bacterium]|nr:GNAT family N-acetyltransferase [Myxococcales bacterium]